MNLKRLITEIHRRSLWQVTGVYLFAGWGAFEVISSLTKTAGLPSWFPAAALAILVLFLPVVLATAFIGKSLESNNTEILDGHAEPKINLKKQSNGNMHLLQAQLLRSLLL